MELVYVNNYNLKNKVIWEIKFNENYHDFSVATTMLLYFMGEVCETILQKLRTIP